ncbi:MAG: hypothetical protein ACD_64C00088G0007 [uncultured bacterium]|jgi:hypothetical protein|nr:MAG: hypothetical protein ACD_64C00088G0007 [uncultured bacterium]
MLEVSASQLLAQPPIMQSRLIILWLTQEGVSFPVTQHFIEEIIRFIESPRGGTHHIHENWSITKQRGACSIKKK